MLAPTDRRLLLDTLAPEDGYELDQAIGTTYTLDLMALLRVPLAATAMPWSSPDGRPNGNPFALLTALRRNADRISLYCHAGTTAVPGRFVPLLSFLEDAIHPVAPPNPRGVFHPKIWLQRFVGEEGDVRHRLLVLSRNLTFDRSWDVALVLDGELRDRKRAIRANAPLAEFIEALPKMARRAGTRLPKIARDRARLLADEVRRVDWEPPEGFDQLRFHPIGHDGRESWPVADLDRLVVIAPFVSAEGIGRIRTGVRGETRLIGRLEELSKLAPADFDGLESVHVFDDQASLLEIGDDPDGDVEGEEDPFQSELSGLHAKVFAGERNRGAAVYVGSANATAGAFESNVEFLVELEGSRTRHGTNVLLESLTDAGLLTEFRPSDPIETDEEESLTQTLERKAHELSCGALRGRVTEVADDRWAVALHAASPTDLRGFRLSARPLSQQMFRAVDPRADPSATFPPTGRTSITPFFVVRLAATRKGKTERYEFVAKIGLEGAPDGRKEAATAELLADRERLLRFILLLLSDEFSADRPLGELERLLAEDRPVKDTPQGTLDALGFPLLEPMLRALHRDPERLGEIAQLIDDMERAGAPDDLLPVELRELWTTINEVRATR